ncbi:hypothetical protein LGM89_01565 [Burkholderia sp. AU31624]|uniref:hypothetical protein n=1 Tax=Burkholderia sp. AU31624 TaxID=2879629 RepID=UPI001CF4A5C4|nr:hypothetical protein [Burkholderia sp. AU31624]MCA8251941.1 hypothetical protein [Burkholderia sp. AU31624]
MSETNNKRKMLSVPRTSGGTFFLIVMLSGGIMVTMALRKGHLIDAAGTIAAVGLCGTMSLLYLLSKEVCVFTGDPRSMQIERRIIGRLLQKERVDIHAVTWIRSRWTIQGITLELGSENSWETIEVQTTYMRLQQLSLASARDQQESRVTEIRASIAGLLNIRDAGWEKYPSQRSLT